LLASTLKVPSRFPMIHSTILFTSAACCKCTWNYTDVEPMIIYFICWTHDYLFSLYRCCSLFNISI
jgi:hypothetical protein